MAACKKAKKEPGFLPASALLLVEAVEPRTHATGSGFPGSRGTRAGRCFRVTTVCLRLLQRQTTLDDSLPAFEVHPDNLVGCHFWFPL
jgi:hypothetical protein